ncbi:hypothetical protein [Halostella litorea]|uniref:hypothetical protein n=1 Tax=Halostella litorea TaxID=2528831 RepID=UPI0010920203|nr:hypothetical protein [Halostella litorea]
MTDRQILAETQTAGLGLANGKVIQRLVLEQDASRPAITVRHERIDHPDPYDDRDPREGTIDAVTVEPTADVERKLEIGTRHGNDRVLVETHDHAPRAYVRHERHDGGWSEQAAWELHPATGITQVGGEAVADGGAVEAGTSAVPHYATVKVDAITPGWEGDDPRQDPVTRYRNVRCPGCGRLLFCLHWEAVGYPEVHCPACGFRAYWPFDSHPEWKAFYERGFRARQTGGERA